MVKLLIVADDFTGALDTGIQFAKQGIETQIFTNELSEHTIIASNTQVLVVNSDTRHLSGEEAGRVTGDIVSWAMRREIPTIYKKTDSALRGNIGSELEAALRKSGQDTLYFIPALPEMNRVTISGTHYIDGIPLEYSMFGNDPFEPVRSSYIPQIIREQSKIPVHCYKVSEPVPESKPDKQIFVFDIQTREDMYNRVKELKEKKRLTLLAGCAGFAAFLPKALGLEGRKSEKPVKTQGLFIACGSLNPITREQVEYAEGQGYVRIRLTPEQKLMPSYYDKAVGRSFLHDLYAVCAESSRVIVDTFDEETGENTIEYADRHGISRDKIRFSITACHGKILRYLAERGLPYTMLITGGDTLMGFMKEMGCGQLHPVCEIARGAVLSNLKWKGMTIPVISKSGGFGDREVMVKIGDQVIAQGGSEYEVCNDPGSMPGGNEAAGGESQYLCG